MVGIYFSGTGNTRHCIVEFVRCFDDNNITISIETSDVDKTISQNDFIVFGYPIYFSNAPKIVRDFIIEKIDCFRNKMHGLRMLC